MQFYFQVFIKIFVHIYLLFWIEFEFELKLNFLKETKRRRKRESAKRKEIHWREKMVEFDQFERGYIQEAVIRSAFIFQLFFHYPSSFFFIIGKWGAFIAFPSSAASIHRLMNIHNSITNSADQSVSQSIQIWMILNWFQIKLKIYCNRKEWRRWCWADDSAASSTTSSSFSSQEIDCRGGQSGRNPAGIIRLRNASRTSCCR